MPILDLSVIRKAKLGLRAKSNTDPTTLLRDLREVLGAIDKRFEQLEQAVENHESRIESLE